MKFTLFGITITNEKSKKNELSKIGNVAKAENTKKRILEGLEYIRENNLKYSEYRLKKVTNLSINTIKKYREFIEEKKHVVFTTTPFIKG